MKKIIFIMFMLCFCLVGFTVGRHTVDVRLEENESIYISRWGNNAYVWVYTYDEITCTWDIKEMKELEGFLPVINVHVGGIKL